MKKILLVVSILVVVLLGTVGLAEFKNEAESSRASKFSEKLDSREVEVGKPCAADEITISEGEATGVGPTCEIAKRDCRGILASDLTNAAHQECNTYSKISEQLEPCKAYRGNFNPTENVEYTDCTQGEDGQYHVNCKIKNPVKYNCN
jgi:hypothetical protein